MGPAPELLVTADVEIAADRDLGAQADALARLGRDLRGIPTTWLCTATAAEAFAAPLRDLAGDGHAIGCHGLDHGAWEDYRRFDAGRAAAVLHEATARVEAALGVRPRAFRGPRMTTSAGTQAALERLGYAADLSVSARRLDPFAASAYAWRWLRVPNRPYRPAAASPFAEGGDGPDLTVLPLSGLGVPFLSGALYTLGPAAVRGLARALARGRRDGPAAASPGPLVYLFHSYEFAGVDRASDRRPRHHRLYPADPGRRYALNQGFLRWLVDGLGAVPLTVGAYLAKAPGANRGASPATAREGSWAARS